MAKELNYHCHVYVISGLIEIDLKAKSNKEAIEKALETSKSMKPKTSDCDKIALPFVMKE